MSEFKSVSTPQGENKGLKGVGRSGCLVELGGWGNHTSPNGQHRCECGHVPQNGQCRCNHSSGNQGVGIWCLVFVLRHFLLCLMGMVSADTCNNSCSYTQ